VELLDPGTQIDAEGLRVGATLGGVLRVGARVGDLAHGDVYRATFEGHAVLLTFVDPVLAAQPDVRSWLLRNVARAATVEHRNLLAQYGTFIHGRRCFVVQADPEGQTARALLLDRASKGRAVDRDAAQTIAGHVCNALTALHRVTVHGYVSLDTVWVSSSGRVLLSDLGVGPLLARMRRFERMRSSGRLPNVAPEQLLAPPPMSPGTDVFGVASLLIELLTGRPLPEGGTPVAALGLHGPPDLVMCLERATAPDAGARPPDVATFKGELSDALRDGAAIDVRPPDAGARPVSIADPRMHSGMLPLHGAAMPPGAPGSMPGMPMQGAPGAVPMQGMPMPGMPMQGAPMGMMPMQGVPMQGMPMQGMPMQGMPMQGMPMQGVPMGMPMQAMPMAMPAAAIPAGFSVVAVPIQGPGGVTMMPMLVGLPGAAPAPTPAPEVSPRAAVVAAPPSAAMRELDRATRRIAAGGGGEGLEAMTEDVSQSATRLASEAADAAPTAAPAAPPAAPPTAAISASALRLDVRSIEEAASRLEPLDAGAPDPERSAPRPDSSGPYFPSVPVDDDPRAQDEAPRLRRGAVALDEVDVEQSTRSYRLVRPGREDVELPLTSLTAMIARGELGAADVLVHPLTQRRLTVFDVPELRAELSRAPVRPAVTTPTPRPVAQRPMLTDGGASSRATWLWIFGALALFGGVGVWLWWRAQGG
jgi:hypothetical protein